MISRIATITVDIGERVFLTLLFLSAFFRFGGPFYLHWTDIIFLMAESFTVLLILLRRPGDVAMKPYAVLVALCGTAGPLLSQPGGTSLIGETTAIMICLSACALASRRNALSTPASVWWRPIAALNRVGLTQSSATRFMRATLSPKAASCYITRPRGTSSQSRSHGYSKSCGSEKKNDFSYKIPNMRTILHESASGCFPACFSF